MYNTDLPRRADLPSSAQLKRSTWIAGIAASAILVLVVLPSEYAIDPTGVGRILGLTEMGEIKTQLAAEAAQDAAAASADGPRRSEDPSLLARLDRIEALLKGIGGGVPAAVETSPESVGAILASGSNAAETRAEQPVDERFAAASTEPAASQWQDEMSFTLPPGQGVEVKLVMNEGGRADFYWTANGAVLNYDTHGDGGGNSVSYEKGRSVPEQEGALEAAFTGNHGWFWRNRSGSEVTLTLRTRGDYLEIKRPT